MSSKSKAIFLINFSISFIIFIVALNTNIDKYIKWSFSYEGREFRELVLGAVILGIVIIKIVLFEKIIKRIEGIEKVKNYTEKICIVVICALIFGGPDFITIKSIILSGCIIDMIGNILFLYNVMRTKKEIQNRTE